MGYFFTFITILFIGSGVNYVQFQSDPQKRTCTSKIYAYENDHKTAKYQGTQTTGESGFEVFKNCTVVQFVYTQGRLVQDPYFLARKYINSNYIEEYIRQVESNK